MKALLNNEPVHLKKSTYSNNNSLALQAVCLDGEPFATLSVNLPESKNLPPNQCYFKHYSENEGLLEQLLSQNLIKMTGHASHQGMPLVEVLF